MVDRTRDTDRIGMPLAAWEQRWQDGTFELIDGEIIEMSPEILQHLLLKKLFFVALLKLEEAGIGQVFSEGTFAQLEGSDWVTGSRIPDVMFYLQERWDKYLADHSQAKPLVLYPDLVVEIISPNDTYTAINRKVRVYLADGVQVIWVVDPRTQTIDIWRSDGSNRQLVKADTLTDALLPGFALELAKIFTE